MKDRETISLSTVLGGIAVIGAVVGIVALVAPLAYQQGAAELRAERGWAATPQATRDVQATQAARIASYAWIDKQRGVVAVPIERAMELVAAESASPAGGGR
ncbi:MAG: hypothetical protein NTY35_06810 [Planctomycetota bacterium]|nr:hypothetical protein [Planctomycetota bacterium]